MTTLVAGSYERFLFAYSIKKAEEDKDQARTPYAPMQMQLNPQVAKSSKLMYIVSQVYTLPRAFSFPAHKVSLFTPTLPLQMHDPGRTYPLWLPLHAGTGEVRGCGRPLRRIWRRRRHRAHLQCAGAAARWQGLCTGLRCTETISGNGMPVEQS